MPRAKSTPTKTTKWKIHLSELCYGPEESEAVQKVLASRWLTMGAQTEKFEATIAKHLGVKHAILVSSGTAALHMALTSLGLGPEDEVIVPSITFVASANTVRHCGANPAFCDIESPEFPLVDLRDAASRITPRTKVLMMVPYGGFPPRMDEVHEFCRRHRLQLLEDAAHAMGSSHHGKPLGTFGALGCFSFFSNKNMATGEGGLVVTNNATLARRLRLLRSQGMTVNTWQRHNSKSHGYDVVALGHNYRPSEITAALALVQLGKLAELNAARAKCVELYTDEFSNEPKVAIPAGDPEGESSHHLMPILLPNSRLRDRVRQSLIEGGIQVSHHYPPVHTFSAYRAQFRTARLPNTELFARRELTLPLHPLLKPKQIKTVTDTVKKALKSA
ncbi:DegT/DnrJ/EryC1/StrS family aminotransferase [Candidatus Sumerlaeota bacterium]|nr:DegT/DnrJ/EryC1/StrS family aminotransferase [Candidatus Sumerlaeota bacterium]